MWEQQENTMVVSGVGTAEVTPDMAQLEVLLEVTDENPAHAFTAVQTVAQRVTAVFDDQGIAEADRQTRDVSLTPHYEHHSGMTATLAGYTATHALRVLVRRLPTISTLLDALVDAAGEALRLGGFHLVSSDVDPARARAEAAAVADARRRGERLAEAAGVSLGPVLAVRDQLTTTEPHAIGLAFTEQSARGPVQAGTDTVQARVTVTFALVS